MPNFSKLRVAFAAAALVVAAPTQNLHLAVSGGSMPGPFELDISGGLPFEFVMLVPSSNSGPTPLGLIDPADPRSLSVGLDLVGNSILALTDLFGDLNLQGQLSLVPNLVDVPLYWQAVNFSGQQTLVNSISNPDVFRFGIAGQFRDRNLQTFDLRAFATALPLPDRKALLVGGARGALLAQVATDTTEVYDPITDLFVNGPTMNAPRSLHTQTELLDGRYLISGGVNAGNNPQASCEIYDPVANTFTAVASMNSPRMGATATLLSDGRVFVTGGLEALSTSPTQLQAIRDAVDSTEIYDPVNDTWTLAPPMSDPRAGHVALPRSDGKILLCGGISWNSNIFLGWVPTVRTSCDIYDPATNTMSAGPSMNDARALVEPVEIGPDRWLLAGGMNGLSIFPYNPGNPTATAEIYDAVANTWTAVGSMATARVNQKGWSIGNGKILLVGGGDGSILAPVPLASTEVFDVATNTFTAGPTMNSPRAAAGILKMPQGQMFLFGGANTGTTITNTTEWYFF
jgi:hypothetical protein